jgi:hypothetical protein
MNIIQKIQYYTERKIMRWMKGTIIKGTGGVIRERKFIIVGRKQEMYPWLCGKVRVELWGMKKGKLSEVRVCRQGEILD